MLQIIFWFCFISSIFSFFGISVISIIKYVKKQKHIKYEYLKPYIITCGVIFIVSATASLLIEKPWSKIHYGDVKQKIIYIDSSKLNQDKTPIKHSAEKQDFSSTQLPRQKNKFQIKGKKDSDKKDSKEDNSIKVDRSPGSIIVGGKGNKVTLTFDRHLTEYGIEKISNSIDSMRNVHNLPKSLVISTYSYFNAPLIMEQLQNYFESKGFIVNTSGTVFGSGKMVNGYKTSWQQDGSSVGIELGYFK